MRLECTWKRRQVPENGQNGEERRKHSQMGMVGVMLSKAMFRVRREGCVTQSSISFPQTSTEHPV